MLKTHRTVNRPGDIVMRQSTGAPPGEDSLVLVLPMMMDVTKRLMGCPGRMGKLKLLQMHSSA